MSSKRPTKWVCIVGASIVAASLSCDPSPSEAQVRVGGGETCGNVGNPRWVLRDKDNNRVQAMVEPRCGHGPFGESWTRCNPLDPGASTDLPCVRIVDHQGSYINLQYDLASGQLGPCQGTESNDDPDADLDSLGYFLNDKCDGDQFRHQEDPLLEPEFVRARTVYYAAGEMWYLAEEGCIGTADTWARGGNKCYGQPLQYSLCPLRVVPQWVKNLLPNPPYTMAVEYD